jgi:hypothetical protein
MCSDTKKRKHGEKKPSKHCSEVKKKIKRHGEKEPTKHRSEVKKILST